MVKFLSDLVKPCLDSKYCPKDSFSFVTELKQENLANAHMVSFDVESLFTNIPLNETIELVLDKIFIQQPDINITRKDLKKLFEFATANTHFLFNGTFYDQIDGVAMGSPLAPILANLFMGHNENNWLSLYSGTKPLFYRRYVDDIFASFPTKEDSENFLIYLNSRHPNIKFTVEHEENGKLPFLDVCVRNGSELNTSIFHKKTYTGLLTNYFSFTSFSYKLGLIKTLVDRTYKINNTWNAFHTDLEQAKTVLLKNQYPKTLIDKTIKNYLDSKYSTKTPENSDNTNSKYFKLPYIGKKSELVKKKLLNLSAKFCKQSEIRVVLTSFKLKQFFQLKDMVPKNCKSNVVYKFVCANCNVCYIGQTVRHLSQRIDEHLKKDKKSHVYQHLCKDINCLDKVTKDCFSILDSAPSEYQLKIKEGLHITWERPQLNKQVLHYNINLI